MAYVPETNSVVAFQSDPTKLLTHSSLSGQVGASIIGLPPVKIGTSTDSSVIAVPQGSIAAAIVSGSIAATFTPPANQSVSGTVGASVVGHAPVVIVGGSILTSSTPNQSVSGTVQTDVRGSVAVAIIAGSIAATFTPPANQSVSGTVQAEQTGTRITSLVSTVPSSVIIGASIFGLAPVNVTNFPGNQSVSGTVQTDVRSSVAVAIIAGSVAVATGNSSVQVLNFPANQSVSGTVDAAQISTWRVSVINSTPSSLLAGVSVIGLTPVNVTNFPTTQNVSGSVVAFGFPTNQNVSGSVVSFQAGTWVPSAIGYMKRNDTLASTLGADGTYGEAARDSAGRTLSKPFAAEEARIEGYHSVVSTSQTTLVAAAGAGLRNYITDFWISNTGATTTAITFKDGAGSILGYTIAPAGGGSNSPGLSTPIRTGANASFDFQPVAASSIIYATVKGYKAP